MKTKAAVAFEAKKPLEIVEIDLEGPKENEVLIEIKATGICHTDEFTLSGADPEGIFPSILGHEGAGIVVEKGKNVKSVDMYNKLCEEYHQLPKEPSELYLGFTNICNELGLFSRRR